MTTLRDESPNPKHVNTKYCENTPFVIPKQRQVAQSGTNIFFKSRYIQPQDMWRFYDKWSISAVHTRNFINKTLFSLN